MLRSQDARCTKDGGHTWEDSGIDVAMTHIAAIDAHRTIVAGSGGQVRFLTNGRVSGGTTIDYAAENHIRFLSVEWGRFITTNSWDGCFELEKDDFLEPRPLGPSSSSLPAC